jgi:hypothetical protein
MRVTVTELKKMIAESVARHMREETPPSAATVSLPRRMPAPVPGPTGEMQTGGVGGKPVGMNKEARLRSMVREVIEEMMDNEKVNEEMYEAEKLKEAVRKMVRAELKRSGK